MASGSSDVLGELLAELGSAPATLVIARALSVPASTTVPPNVQLLFVDGGRLVLAAGITMTIASALGDNHPRQIFEYADDTCALVLASGGALRPEWFGVASSGAADLATARANTVAYRRLLRVPAGAARVKILHQCVTYWFAPLAAEEAVLPFWQDGVAHAGWSVLGDGARLSFTGMGADQIAVKLGTTEGRTVDFRADFLVWDGVGIAGDQTPRTLGLVFANAGFAQVSRCSVGGFGFGVVATEYGGNSNRFTDVFAAGYVDATTGALAGTAISFGPLVDLAHGGTFHGWTWSGGRSQEADVILHAYASAGFRISEVDFSNAHTTAVKLDSCSEFDAHFYTESIGPGVIGNTAKVVHLTSCSSGAIHASRINGGGSTPLGSAGYGVYLGGSCSAISLRELLFIDHRLADVHVEATCDAATIGIDETCTHQLDATLDSTIVLSDATKRGVRWGSNGRTAAPTNETPIPRVLSPNDLTDASAWTLTGGAAPTGVLVLAPDGVTLVPELELPTPGSSYITSKLGAPLAEDAGGEFVLRFWMRPTGRASVDPNLNRHLLLAQAGREPVHAVARHFDGAWSASGRWQLCEVVCSSLGLVDGLAAGMVSNIQFACAPPSLEGIKVAICGVEVFARDGQQQDPTPIIHRVTSAPGGDYRRIENIKAFFDPASSSSTSADRAQLTGYTDLMGNCALLVPTTAGQGPAYVASGIGGKPSLLFTAASSQDLHSSTPLSTIISKADDFFWAVIHPRAISTSNPLGYLDVAVISGSTDGAQYRNIYLAHLFDLFTVGAYGFSGGAADITQTIATPADLPAGPSFLVMSWHLAGSLFVQVNDGVPASVPCGDIDAIGGLVTLGHGTGFYDGLLAKCGVHSAFTEAARAQVTALVNAEYALW